MKCLRRQKTLLHRPFSATDEYRREIEAVWQDKRPLTWPQKIALSVIGGIFTILLLVLFVLGLSL